MLSFIIPTLNEEKTIGRTLSVFSELKIPHEVIVSDGKSGDRTVEIAKSYNAKVIVYEGSVRQTIAGGKNLGASIASGNFLVFLDADIIIPDVNNFFEKLLGIFNKEEGLVGVTVCQRALPEVETIADRFFFKMINWTFFLMNNIMHFGGAPGEFQMVRVDDFKKIGGFDQGISVGEDADMFQRMAKIGRTKIIMSLYVMHPVRRAHKLGWIRLIIIWWANWISTTFFKRSYNSVWKEVR